MATVVVRADRPVEGDALVGLAAATPLTEAETATLYRSALADVASVVEQTGASLLVTHPEDQPDDEDRLRDIVEPVLDAPEDARFEPQVGSSPAARMGNTVTHLLETEGESSVGVLDPTAVLLTRSSIDGAAMTLRRDAVVVGPATAGGAYYAGFTEPIDFASLDRPMAVEALVAAADDAGLSANVLDPSPTLSSLSGLRTAVPILRARRQAGLPVPERTTAALEELDLRVVDTENEN
jgi:hypothetical protein